MKISIDFDINDIVDSWDKKQRLMQSVEKSINLSQIILLIAYIFVNNKKNTITLKEVSDQMGTTTNYAYNLLETLVVHGVMNKHNVKGKKGRIYVLTDEKLFNEIVEKAKENFGKNDKKKKKKT